MKSVFISRIQFLVFILLFTLFISCDNNEDFDVVVEVEAIEENKYSIKVQNTGSRIAYLTQCTSSSYVKTVQIKIDNNWEQSGYGGPCLDVYAISSVYLYVGQSLIDSLIIQSHGVYRVGIAISQEYLGTPGWEYSNEFEN